MDSSHVLGWVTFFIGLSWRILDEAAAKLLFWLAGAAASLSKSSKDVQ